MLKLVAKTVLGHTIAEIVVDGTFKSINKAKTKLQLKYGTGLVFTEEQV